MYIKEHIATAITTFLTTGGHPGRDFREKSSPPGGFRGEGRAVTAHPHTPPTLLTAQI